MKNLVILGVPRAGKTNLSKQVAIQLAKDGFVVSLIPGDTLISSLEKCRNTPLWKIFVRPFRHLLPLFKRISKKRLVNNMLIFIKNFIRVIPDDKIVIFEGAYISPEKAVKSFDKNNTKIVIIGYPNADIKQKMADIRKYNRGVSPLRNKPDDELNKIVQGLVAQSRNYQETAKKYNLAFVDTSTDYYGAINKFAENIKDFLDE